MNAELLIGSANCNKARELAELLEGLPWTVVSLAEKEAVAAPEENGDTFADNALLKARYYAKKFNMPCIADDSGLIVDYLDGAPGILSARYAGFEGDDANNEKLLIALEEALCHERTARFLCCAVFYKPDGELVHLETGEVEGHISVERFGSNGFGYDCLFVPEGHEITFAEMTASEKHALSHRGRAFEKMRRWLEKQS